MKKIILINLLISQIAIAQKLPKNNELILAFAEQNLGKKVGDGVCRTLTNEAYYAARTSTIKNEKLKPKKIDHKRGSPGYKNKSIDKTLPGDFISFYYALIYDDDPKTEIVVSHIGIVKAVEEDKIIYYNQKVIAKGQKTRKHSKVQVDTLLFAELPEWSFSTYRIK